MRTINKKIKQLIEKPFAIMGVVNVTPDSFYDGGRYNNTADAGEKVRQLIDEGADIIDIGGESTRPGSRPVSQDEELDRIIPVIESARKSTDVLISVDTSKAAVAASAVKAGADIINDISAGRFDPEMPGVAARHGAGVIIMHSRETPETMQDSPVYADVVREVRDELLESIEKFRNFGVNDNKIIIDPGIGFGKRLEDNLDLLNNLSSFHELGYPLLAGVSRKSFIGKITGRDTEERLAGTLGSVCAAFMRGAKIFRVHDAVQTRDCLSMLWAVISR